MKKLVFVASMLAVSMSQPAIAGGKEKKTYLVVNEAVGVPVFPHNIKDREYQVVGEVKAGVRKATVFSKSPSQEKIYRELWERAEKLGADAVINATYGDAHVTAFSWGKANAKGTAIRFKTAASPAAAVAPRDVEAPAAKPATGAPGSE